MLPENNNSIIAKVNDVLIIVLEKEKLVPIKPICEALGIAMEPQRIKINEDDILASTATLSMVVAADGKAREMVCLPLEYAFGWLFTINHKNVKPGAQEAVKKYKIECYHALYKHFTEYSTFMEERQKAIDDSLAKIEVTKKNFTNTKTQLQEEQEALNQARKMNFNDWKAKQMSLQFE